ncbi:MAG: 1-acyl-sn-glycerol-3-phosphate acyltransferase [Rhizobiaceae bacterium]|nr:1-acyl-sn-glycerol-3-phosphate acyltransferase [Rhizobiaceae bacterium]
MFKRNEMTAFGGLTEALQLLTYGRPGHIVDELIAERGTGIMSHPLWPVIRPIAHTVLHYREAIQFADATSQLSGHDSFEYISQILKLQINVDGFERIPRQGAFLLVSNHPTGIADGIAMYDMLKGVRPDMMFFANRDAVRVNPRLNEIIIPVEWREEHKSRLKARETLQLTSKTFKEDKAGILFPSGRIAYWDNDKGKLAEREWKPSVYSMARKYNLPILPVNMSSRNSGLFYFLSKYSAELRDITVFHELLNKKNKIFNFKIGNIIMPDQLGSDMNAATRALEEHTVHGLIEDMDRKFDLRYEHDLSAKYASAF